MPRDASITVSDRAEQESIELIVVEKICNSIQSHELDIAHSMKMRLNEFDLAHTFHTDTDWLRLLLEYCYGGSDQNEFGISSNS